MARLTWKTDEGSRIIPLQPKNVLGRHPQCSIQLLDKIASKEHCTIEQRGQSWILRDMGSSNGTTVNGVRIDQEVVLAHGDVISIGGGTGVFDDGSGALPESLDTVAEASTPAIFISYRRADTAWPVGRIRDHLVLAFGHHAVFEDVVSIPLGVDFRDHIRERIKESVVAIVVIGPQWSGERAGGARIFEVADHVRAEVAIALSSGVSVVPLMVGDAEVPQSLPDDIASLAFLNGLRVRPDPDFRTDLSVLLTFLRKALEKAGRGLRPRPLERVREVQPMAYQEISAMPQMPRMPATMVPGDALDTTKAIGKDTTKS